MNMSNGIPDFDGTKKVATQADPNNPAADKNVDPDNSVAGKGQHGSDEVPDAASEADVPLDGRDLEGEAMIRELPMNPDLSDAPKPP